MRRERVWRFFGANRRFWASCRVSSPYLTLSFPLFCLNAWTRGSSRSEHVMAVSVGDSPPSRDLRPTRHSCPVANINTMRTRKVKRAELSFCVSRGELAPLIEHDLRRMRIETQLPLASSHEQLRLPHNLRESTIGVEYCSREQLVLDSASITRLSPPSPVSLLSSASRSARARCVLPRLGRESPMPFLARPR